MTDINIDLARYNMIEQQIRPWDVLDPKVLEVIAETPRERFVPHEYANLAFTDTRIPLIHGQSMLEPKMEGRILQSLQIKPTDRILEIGTGAGFLTACLAKLGGNVVSVDIFPEFSQQSQQLVIGLGIDNAQFQVGDASHGWDQDGEFDIIAITGSLFQIPETFKRSLTIGGRLFAVSGDDVPMAMDAQLIKRLGKDEFSTESLFETYLSALINAEKPQTFVF